MFNLDTFKAYSRAAAFGAVTISAIAFAGAANAAPGQNFPFFQQRLEEREDLQRRGVGCNCERDCGERQCNERSGARIGLEGGQIEH